MTIDFTVRLTAQGTEEPAAHRDEPLIFTVGLVDYEAARASSSGAGLAATRSVMLGRAGRPVVRDIGIHLVTKKGPAALPARPVLLGRPGAPTRCVIDATRVFHADFGLEAGRLKVGKYTLAATFRSRQPKIAFVSDPIELTVRGTPRPGGVLLARAEFEFRRGKLRKALGLVSQRLSQAPDDIDALVVAGDIHEALRRKPEARALYAAALVQFKNRFPKSMEQPADLLRKLMA